ncbi:MAG: restriction endonuclease subunit S [Luteolibacter sp.]
MSRRRTKAHAVPPLRFAGFTGDWQTGRVDSFLVLQRGFDLTKKTSSGNGKYPVYSSSGISYYHDEFKVRGPGLITGRKGSVGPVFLVNEDFWPHDTSLWVKDFKGNDIGYLYYFLIHFDLTRFDEASSVPTLNRNNVHRESTAFPTLPEQRKIADFLTAVDGRTGQLSQKKALLEDYKKGVMQQLFTQALRFKDDHGKDFPEWEEKRYADIYTFQNTNSYSRDLLNYDDGEVRNIHYGDIHTKFKSNFYLTDEKVPFIKPEVNLLRISDACYCRVGDLVIADASEDYADIGKCIEIRDLGGQRTLAGLHTFIARPKKDAMAPGFGSYLMQSRKVRLKIMTIAQGTKVLGISKTQLSEIMLPIPHPKEQTKIANFLTALDRKIESVANQITHTQTFKKGLLQQMFV